MREDLRKVVADAAIDFRLGKGGRTASSDGHQSYESKLALRGCTDQAIWTRPDGEIEFTCQLFPPSRDREGLYERLNRRVAAIIAVLPAGWEVQRYPAAEPYHPVVVARDTTGRVELTAHVTPFVDGTFSAGLSVTRKVPRRDVEPLPVGCWVVAARREANEDQFPGAFVAGVVVATGRRVGVGRAPGFFTRPPTGTT